MLLKSGLDFLILKLNKPLQRYLVTCQANSAFLDWFFCTGQQQLWSLKGLVQFQNKKNLDHFSSSFLSQKWSLQEFFFIVATWKKSWVPTQKKKSGLYSLIFFPGPNPKTSQVEPDILKFLVQIKRVTRLWIVVEDCKIQDWQCMPKIEYTQNSF